MAVPRLLGINPWARRQGSGAGKRIQTVEFAAGRVYVGYGDWRRNTGPVAITSWDPTVGDWTWHLRATTEAIERYRVLADGIVAPYTDPSAAADYARGPEWVAARAGDDRREAFYHVFDAVETGSGLFLVGTRHGSGEALVRRWLDGRWEDSLLLAGRTDWFWFGALLNGELWVQSERQGAFRFDGTTWQPAPSLFRNPRVRAVVSVGDRVAAITRESGPGHLQVSDGMHATFDAPADAWDLNVDQHSGWVYLLREGWVERSRNLTDWEPVPVQVPPGATALDAGAGQLWFGTADSRLWVVDLPGDA